MAIVKGELLTENKSDIIYPKTSIDQVEGLNEFFTSKRDTGINVSNNCYVVLYVLRPPSGSVTWKLTSNDGEVDIEFTRAAVVNIRRINEIIMITYLQANNACSYTQSLSGSNMKTLSVSGTGTLSPIWDIYDYTKLK